MGLYVHTYDPGPDGRCQEVWYDSAGDERVCGSRQRSSVLHDDPESEFRERHWHGGGDCMCFEDPNGPSWSEALERFVRSRS